MLKTSPKININNSKIQSKTKDYSLKYQNKLDKAIVSVKKSKKEYSLKNFLKEIRSW